MRINKKGGVVNDLIFGVGFLILGVVVLLIIVVTILNANLLKSNSVTTTRNETMIVNNGSNSYSPVLANWNKYRHDFTIVQIVNNSGVYPMNASNYTFDSTTGKITNKTSTVFMLVNVTYSYIDTTLYEDTVTGSAENFSSGINNVSTKIPTILLIAAVVLLFSILLVLVIKAKQMGVEGTGSKGFGGGSSGGSIDAGYESSVGGSSGGSL